MKRILASALLVSLQCCALSATSLRAADEHATDAVTIGNNTFALEAWKKLPKEGNLIWSPFNFRMAMTVCYYGARNSTACEFETALSIDKQVKAMDYAKIALKALTTKDDQIKVANGFWVDDSVKVNDFYKAFLSGLGAKCETVPFSKESEKIREDINSWVSEKTKEKIKELLNKGTIGPDTQCVIASTIYFKADWEKPFNKELSKNAMFVVTRAGNDHVVGDVSVPFMEVHGNFQYFETDDAQVVELPYKGKETSMVIILPKDKWAPLNVELLDKLGLTKAMTGQYKTDGPSMKNTNLMIALPKWKASCEVKGTKLMKDMGVLTAFTDQAQFTGAFGKDSRICLSEVIHKAVIEVDEKGTEAAAGTGGVMRSTAIIEKPKAFKADHPFMYLIRHEQTGAVLFMGRVENPKEN